MTREQLCSQQAHCLSCPLSVLRTGRDCHEIKEDIMYIEGRWYTEPELVAYIKELKVRNAELGAKHWDECRQIAHYDDEIKRLKAADINEAHEVCPWCGFPVITKDGDTK